MCGNKKACGALARCRAIHPRTDRDENPPSSPSQPYVTKLVPANPGGWRPSDLGQLGSDKEKARAGGRTHHPCALYGSQCRSSDFPRRRSHIRSPPAANHALPLLLEKTSRKRLKFPQSHFRHHKFRSPHAIRLSGSSGRKFHQFALIRLRSTNF
jgi:hypothetical protein